MDGGGGDDADDGLSVCGWHTLSLFWPCVFFFFFFPSCSLVLILFPSSEPAMQARYPY